MTDVTLPHAASVDISLWHPIFLRRLSALCDAVPGLYALSGPRTKAKQVSLWLRWKAGNGNLAANPYRRIGKVAMFGEVFIARGSWHMVQETGWSYAADMQPDHLIPFELVPWHSDWLLGAAAPFGLTRTVQPSRRSWEPWHLQPLGMVTTVYDGLTDEETTRMLDTYIYVRGVPSNRYGFTNGTRNGPVALRSTESVKAHRGLVDPDGELPASVEIPDALFDDLFGAG